MSDLETMQRLYSLAQRIYREFSLRTLVRLDVRADEKGQLHVLEVNPKPDLKRPTEQQTSLTVAGLAPHNMGYNDLIYTLVADRLDYLFMRNPHLVGHIFELLNQR